MGLYSKYCNKKIIYPNPRTHSDLFIKYLVNMVKNDTYECILPSHTYTAFLLSKYKDILSDYTKVPQPDLDVFMNAYDKEMLLKIATAGGITCPKTYFSNSLDEILADVDEYPVVVKPSQRHGVGIEICNSKSDLENSYTKMWSKYGPCIVQEYIPNGGELGVYTLFNFHSEPIALTVQKRIRSLFPYGGISTLRRTLADENLVHIAFNLLKMIRWYGVAMVEFRFDARDGTPKLMEINPRFWGSLQLSVLSGVDFPYLLYRLANGDNLEADLCFKENVQCRWLLGDIAAFFQCSNKIKNLRGFLRFKDNYDVISLSDPKPMIISILPPYDIRGGEQWEENVVVFEQEEKKL